MGSGGVGGRAAEHETDSISTWCLTNLQARPAAIRRPSFLRRIAGAWSARMITGLRQAGLRMKLSVPDSVQWGQTSIRCLAPPLCTTSRTSNDTLTVKGVIGRNVQSKQRMATDHHQMTEGRSSISPSSSSNILDLAFPVVEGFDGRLFHSFPALNSTLRSDSRYNRSGQLTPARVFCLHRTRSGSFPGRVMVD